MLRKFIQVEDGIIRGSLIANLPEDAPVPDGLTEVPADTDLTDTPFRAYADGVIGEKETPAPARVISRDEFLDRITIEEEARLRLIGEDPATPADTRAMIASFTARIYARVRVDLDDARMVDGFALCKAVGMWPDEATADARISAIRS